MPNLLSRLAGKPALSIGAIRGTAAALAVAVIAIAAGMIARDYQRTVAQERSGLSAVAAAISEQTDHAFHDIDLALDEAVRMLTESPVADAADLARRAAGMALYQRLRGVISAVPQLDAVTVIGRDGRLLNFSRYFPVPDVNVADRDYFLALSQQSAPSKFLSEPVQNRGTGTWTIYVARRLTDAEGRFAGLVLGAIALDYFDQFYNAVKLDRGGAIRLWRTDGTLLADFPRSHVIGQRRRYVLPLDGLAPGGQRVWQTSQTLNGESRLMVLSRLVTQPVAVVVSRDMDNVLDGWRSDSLAIGLIALVRLIVVLMVMELLTAQVRAGRALADASAARETAEAARRRAEEHLLQAQKMEAIGRVSAGVAHDFNNLLMVVSDRAERMEERAAADPIARQYAATIRQAVQQGTRLTQQMLAFSRQQILVPEILDPNAVLHQIQDLLRSSVGGRVSLELRLAADPWPVLADRGQLENALLNLVINARDAMPAGGCVTVSTSNRHFDASDQPGQLAAGDYARISIADSGTGMTETVKARAFEPFFSTKERSRGSGLGLSQVVGFVRQSQGDVVIDTQVGAGTTVHICLPRQLCPAQARTPARKLPPAPTLPALEPAKRGARDPTVMVVDDDGGVRDVMVSMLEALGARVVSAASGAEGLRLLDGQQPIDLILTDYTMPGMTGAEFAGRIRGMRPDVSIAFVTGYATPDALVNERWVLHKPFSLEAMAGLLRQALMRDGLVTSS